MLAGALGVQTHPAFATRSRPGIAPRNPTLSVFLCCVLVTLSTMRQGVRQQQQEGDPWDGHITGVGGVAYGGYARKVVGRALDRLPGDGTGRVEDHPEILSAALQDALLLVEGLKRRC